MIEQNLKFENIGGQMKFSWSESEFKKIVRILNLNPEIYNYQSKAFYQNYPEPFKCRLRVLQTGILCITGAKSKEIMQQLIFEEILSVIMSQLADTNISIVDDLSITTFDARVGLQFEININKLKQQCQIISSQKVTNNQVVLPEQIHQIDKVIIVVNDKQVVFKKAHILPDIYLASLYVHMILLPFRKDHHKQLAQQFEKKFININIYEACNQKH